MSKAGTAATIEKSARPKWAKMVSMLSSKSKQDLAGAIPAGKTRLLSSRPIGKGGEGTVYGSFTPRAGETVTKIFDGYGSGGTTNMRVKAEVMRAFPDLFAKVYSAGRRGGRDTMVMEKLAPHRRVGSVSWGAEASQSHAGMHKRLNQQMSRGGILDRLRVAISPHPHNAQEYVLRKGKNKWNVFDLQGGLNSGVSKGGIGKAFDPMVERIKSAAMDPRKLWAVLQRARKLKQHMGPDVADRFTIDQVGKVFSAAKGSLFKHPDVQALGVTPGMRHSTISAMLKGLKTTPAITPPKPLTQGLFDFSKKASGGKWRLLQHLTGIGRKTIKGFDGQLAQGKNLAALKQEVGAGLRASGASPISRRVLAQRQAAAATDKSNYYKPFRGNDDAMMAARDRLRAATQNSHQRLFSRYGQKMPTYDVDTAARAISDRVFRGTVGGSPRAGGTYGGAFHYASPLKSDAMQYTGIPAKFYRGDASDKMSILHHFAAPKGQRYGHPWAPEKILAGKTHGSRAEAARHYTPQPVGTPITRSMTETAVIPKYNPYLGTELSVGASSQHGAPSFFPAGRPARAAQNYANQVSQNVRLTSGGALERFTGQANINTTPWRNSLIGNPALQRLSQSNPSAFESLMSRHVAQYLAP